MEKINFTNYPNMDKPVNSNNLNQLQENTENAIKDTCVFAQMFANGLVNLPNDSNITIEKWATTGNISVGGFECAPSSNRINIPANSCEYIEIFGQVSGNNNTIYYFYLYNEDDTLVAENRMLVQPSGNSYYATALGSKIIKIPDKTKSYYLKLDAGGYQSAATFNTGFGDNFSYIGVKKIK